MLFFTLFLFLILTYLFLKAYLRTTSGLNKCSKHLVGKVVIVTGGSSGIGFETAKDLADRGAKVIIASNDEEQETSVRHIISATGNTNVHFKYLDLGSLASVRNFANWIIKTEKKLDILINNAGVVYNDNRVTDDGFCSVMQINYFGPFLLTNLLLPLLKTSAPSRIINVSSMAYRYGKLDFEDLKGIKEKISMMKVYSNSKLCIVLMTAELARLLDGTGVTANCLHPGFVRTTIFDRFIWPWCKQLSIIRFVSKSPWEGAQTTIYLAVSPDEKPVSGHYFSECRQQKTSETARNPVLARRLWEVSEILVNLK